MHPSRGRTWLLLLAGFGVIAAIAFFPRVLAFAELAAREMRYLWWLVLLVAVGLWLAFFAGEPRE